MKKITYGLVVLFVLNIVFLKPVFAFNDMTSEKEKNIEMTLYTGLIRGDEYGKFNPDKNITRAEMTVILLRLVNGSNISYVKEDKFNDIKDHWARDYINAAASYNFIRVGEDKMFYPDKDVNFAELITMCLRVIGVGNYLDTTGMWPNVHMDFVLNEGVITDYPYNVYEPMKRYDVALLLENILTASMWQETYRNVYEKTDDIILTKYLGYTMQKDVFIDSIDTKNRDIDILKKDKNDNYTLRESNIDLHKDVNINELYEGQLVSLLVKNKEVLKVMPSEAQSLIEVTFDSVKEFNYDKEYLKISKEGKEERYYLNDDTLRVFYDGDSKSTYSNTYTSVLNFIDNSLGYGNSKRMETTSGRLILDSEDRIISLTFVRYTKMLIVKEVKDSKIINNDDIRTYSDLNLKNKTYTLKDKDGFSLELSDLKKDDIILYENSEPYNIMVVGNNVIRGKVGTTSDDYIKVDGRKYYINKAIFSRGMPIEGKTITMYLDHMDRVLTYTS